MGKKLPVGHIPVSFNALAMGHPLRMYCRKLESADEDDITLHSFALTQYWRVTDGRIDRQKCCSSLHRSALLCAVIMQLWAILNSTVISHSPNLTSWFFRVIILWSELYYDPRIILWSSKFTTNCQRNVSFCVKARPCLQQQQLVICSMSRK